MKIKCWSSVLLALCLSSTLVAQRGSRYLDNPIPQDWQRGGIQKTPADTLFNESIQPIDNQWWKAFGDSMLDSLITVASTQNYSVLSAVDRMDMAQANLRIERGSFFPSILANAGWGRQQSSGNISQLPQSITQSYSGSLNASWEIDLFGSIRQRVKAQRENFAASKEEYAWVRLSLCAQVASAYIGLRELQQEFSVVMHNCNVQMEVLRITEARYKTGLVSKLDVAQAKSVYYSTQASIPQLEAGINQYITTLAILMGTYPQEIRLVLKPIGRLPDYMEPIGIGIPADLLLRRPDIRQAERLVQAQAALLGASKSEWLPQVFLKSSIGYAAHNLKELTKRNSLTFEIAPSISWTLFNGTKLINGTRLARAQLDEAIHQFNQTVLTSVQETDNAMNAYSNSIQQIVALRQVCHQGEETLKLSVELYKEGLSPFQNVLDALRSLLSYQNQLVQAQGNSLLQLIALY